MKIKGIPIWEQYLEFIVLGVAAVVFIGFTAMQFIGNPNAVEVQPHGVIGPGEVDEVLTEEAQRIRPRLESERLADGEVIPDPEPVLQEFQRRLASAVSPKPRLEMPQMAIALGDDFGAVAVDVAFVEPEIPAPHDVITEQYFDALPPETVQGYPALAERMPEQPYDLTWVTAAATFDIATVLQEFRRSGPDGTPAPVPTAWYDGRVTIVDVVVEREEQVNGGWTNLTQLDPIPGQYSLRDRLNAEDLNANDRDQIAQVLSDASLMLDIVQPEFYATRNASWYPPSPETADVDAEAEDGLTDEEIRIRQYKQRLAQKRAELVRIEQRLEDAGGELYPEGGGTGGGGLGGGGTSGGDRGGDRGGGGAGPAPGGGSMGRGDLGDRGGAVDEGQRKRRIALTKQRDTLMEDLTEIEQRLTELGEKIEPADTGEAMNPFDAETMMVWGHDLGVEPGRTYRYRFTVRVLNPYFKRDIHLVEEQKPLAESVYVASKTSAWSKPVQAKPPLEAYITAANAPLDQGGRVGRLGLGQAFVDVFRFYDGRWWKERFTVEPGERIGEMKSVRRTDEPGSVEIDFGTDWYVLDIVADLDRDSRTAGSRSNATVLLQSITSPERTMWRDPADDADSMRRQELEQQVRDAELASADGAPAS